MKKAVSPNSKTKKFSPEWYEELVTLEQDQSITRSEAHCLELITRFLDFGKRYFFDKYDWEFWVANQSGSMRAFKKSNYQQRLNNIRQVSVWDCHQEINLRAVLGSVTHSLLKVEFISSQDFNFFTHTLKQVFDSDITDRETLNEANKEWSSMYNLTLQKIAGAVSAKDYFKHQKKYKRFLYSLEDAEKNMENGKNYLFHILTTGDLSMLD